MQTIGVTSLRWPTEVLELLEGTSNEAVSERSTGDPGSNGQFSPPPFARTVALSRRPSRQRLYQIALALGVEISYFFMDADPDGAAQTRAQETVPQQQLVRKFTLIESRKHQEALCQLARALRSRLSDVNNAASYIAFAFSIAIAFAWIGSIAWFIFEFGRFPNGPGEILNWALGMS